MGAPLEAERVNERERGCQPGALLPEIVDQPASGLLKGRLLVDDRHITG
jgi:hypothetical protein